MRAQGFNRRRISATMGTRSSRDEVKSQQTRSAINRPGRCTFHLALVECHAAVWHAPRSATAVPPGFAWAG